MIMSLTSPPIGNVQFSPLVFILCSVCLSNAIWEGLNWNFCCSQLRTTIGLPRCRKSRFCRWIASSSMFPHRQNYFQRFSKPYPLLKLVDVYDKESFIREYVLDNVFVCIFMYILFYFAVWYAHKVIKRIEQKNREMLETVEKNRSKLDDIVTLKNKRAQYEEIVVKARCAQKSTTKQLDGEIKRLSLELGTTMIKLNELEKFLEKWKFWKNGGERPTKKMSNLEGDSPERFEESTQSFEDVKILEPSFPPSTPPEPPPRKFGVFARPPKLITIQKFGIK